jgi:hypothetical protein
MMTSHVSDACRCFLSVGLVSISIVDTYLIDPCDIDVGEKREDRETLRRIGVMFELLECKARAQLGMCFLFI